VRNKKRKERKERVATDEVNAKSAGAAVMKKAKSSDRAEYETVYCYSEEERQAAVERLSPNPEITRFKGLGEISPDEFVHFIGPEMRLEPVTLHKSDKVKELLEYYMGKNTMERQNFIIDNLVVEEDLAEEDAE
jgi:topoisomerase-4 subunit B